MSRNHPCNLSILKRTECHMNFGIQNEDWYDEWYSSLCVLYADSDVPGSHINIYISSLTLTLHKKSVREELLEKRCFAELLCQREAMAFYHQPMIKHNQVNTIKHKHFCVVLLFLLTGVHIQLVWVYLITVSYSSPKNPTGWTKRNV